MFKHCGKKANDRQEENMCSIEQRFGIILHSPNIKNREIRRLHLRLAGGHGIA